MQRTFYSLEGPLETPPGQGQMRIANLAGFPRLVRCRGEDPRALLERHGIDPRALADPDHHLACRAFVDLLEHASRRLNDPLFGLHLAAQQDDNVFGAVAALCRAAATVRQAVTAFIDYIPVVHSPATRLELVEGRAVAELRWQVDPELAGNRQANFQAVLLDLRFLQLVSGGALRPCYAELAVDARPGEVAELERALGCPFRPHTARNAIAFPTWVLDRPVPSASRVVFQLLSGYLDRLRQAAARSLPERVEDWVRGALPSGRCSLERCADHFGMSVRSLQAHLAEAGSSFSEVVERIRRQAAEEALAGSDESVEGLAERLGYAEPSSFGRAFRRWTGLSPRQYRRLHRIARGTASPASPPQPS
ncbi:MAG: transcriptional regulator [Porticoccaceae bacterium]|nr:MAG: transcriptional regulator [Porticoccaceae bacterium]